MMSTARIITPHALPMFREDRPKSSRRALEKARKDPVASRRPDMPMYGKGSGGRVAAAGSTLSSFIVRNLGIAQRIDNDDQVRLLLPSSPPLFPLPSSSISFYLRYSTDHSFIRRYSSSIFS